MKKTIEVFKNRSSFNAAEAAEIGISTRMLSYYAKKGRIERLARGLYRYHDYKTADKNLKWEELAVATKAIPGGVVCLVSALNYYQLTDERMREHWVAVSHGHSHARFPGARIIRMRNTKLGLQREKIGGLETRIFDPERTIIDSFRLLDFETAMKSLRLYMQGKCGQPNIKKLQSYAKELRADVAKYIAPFTV